MNKRKPLGVDLLLSRASRAPLSQPATARERRAARLGRSGQREDALPPDLNSHMDPLPPQARAALQKEENSSALPHRSINLGFDVPLLLVLCTLVIVGMIVLFSASWKYSLSEYGSPTTIFLRQLVFLGVGLAAGGVLVFFDYHHWPKLVVPVMVATVVALILVLLVQDERHGAVRSILGGSIQPSELAKLGIILYLSVWLYNRREHMRDMSLALVPLGVILGIVGGLIAAQPDLSAVLTIMILGGMLFFLAGGDLRQVAFVLVLGVTVGGLFLASGVFATGSNRIGSFLAGLRDPLQASDHVQRSLEAFVQGGWLGVGIGKGTSKLTVLPFPHTDSIFAVIGEETGVIGASFVVLLYALLMWRGLHIARNAPDQLGTLLAAGLTFWITMEALVNMAVMVGLMPFAGNALPFVSAGGSNRVVSLVAVGIILSISRYSAKNKREEERTFSAIVDLRRRDWRRSVPGSRRTSGARSER